MKITRKQLENLIREELMKESSDPLATIEGVADTLIKDGKEMEGWPSHIPASYVAEWCVEMGEKIKKAVYDIDAEEGRNPGGSIGEALQTEKLVGKGVAKGLIQDLEDLKRTLGLFDAASLQKFPDVHKELIQLANDVSDKLKYIKDSARQFRESKSNKDSLKKIILEELQEVCGMSHDAAAVTLPKDHSMDSQEGESLMAKGSLHHAIKSAQEIDSVLGDDVDLPEWVEAKLTKAADYLGIVSDYLTYKDSRGAMPAASMDVPKPVQPPLDPPKFGT